MGVVNPNPLGKELHLDKRLRVGNQGIRRNFTESKENFWKVKGGIFALWTPLPPGASLTPPLPESELYQKMTKFSSKLD